MREKIQEMTSMQLFALLVFGFLAFYAIQIPLVTYSTDTIVFAVRSLSDSPITGYAYLNQRSPLGPSPLPNYHFGHTVALWLAYHAFPSTLSQTIWPAGFVSTIAGALCTGLTFLIWRRLQCTKVTSFAAAAISGLIHPIWSLSVIGEVYILQLFFTLLFLLGILINHLVIATFALLLSLLVSPIAGLSLSLVLLASPAKHIIFRTGFCALLAFVFYLLIMHLLGIDIWRIFGGLTPSDRDRSIVWKLCAFALIFCLNINVLFPSLIRGINILWSEDRTRLAYLALAISPWLFLPAVDSTFLQVRGDFLLLVFWALCLPIGLGLSVAGFPKRRLFATGFGLVFFYVIIYQLPDTSVGLARTSAGSNLRTLAPEKIKLIGPWDVAVPLVATKYGWSLEQFNDYYIGTMPNTAVFDESVLLRTGEKSLLVAFQKKDYIRRQLIAWGFPWYKREFSPQDIEGSGTVRKIFENEAVIVYRWDKGLDP